MKTIHKYKLELTDYQRVFMPNDAVILSAQMQGEDLCIWAIHEIKPKMQGFDHLEEKIDVRQIAIHGTGHKIQHDGKFIDTVQLRGGLLIFHVFDLGPVTQ